MNTRLLIILLLSVSNLLSAQKADVEFLPNLPYDKYTLPTGQDTLTYYLSVTSSKEKLPLVVYIQGSGYNSLFARKQDGQIVTTSGHLSWYIAAQERYRLLIVEKPGVKYLQSGESASFDERFSLQSWSHAIVTAIDHALRHEDILAGQVLVAGHSEGGVVASRVASLLDGRASHVAVLAGEGPSQLYSLYKLAEDGTFFNTPEHNMPTAAQRIQYLENKWQDILKDPGSTRKKFWGFTYLRWSSMLTTSVIDELAAYKGKILLVQGTADKSVHPEAAIVSYTSLLSKGRDVQLELFEGADHSFNIADNPQADGWKLAIQAVTDWFLSTRH